MTQLFVYDPLEPYLYLHLIFQHYLELVSVGSSCLAHKDPGPGVQLHGIRRALKLHHLRLRVTALVEGHLLLEHSQGEAAPLVHQARHVKAGRLVRSLGVRLGVEELHPLAAGLHRAQFDADVHDPLGPVGDGEEDGGGGRGGLDMEEEGEVAVERVGDVGQSQLARHRRGGENVGGPALRPVDPGDLIRGRVSDQLEQRDAALFCKKGRFRVRKLKKSF